MAFRSITSTTRTPATSRERRPAAGSPGRLLGLELFQGLLIPGVLRGEVQGLTKGRGCLLEQRGAAVAVPALAGEWPQRGVRPGDAPKTGGQVRGLLDQLLEQLPRGVEVLPGRGQLVQRGPDRAAG